jgi:hypothetical protein
MKPGASEARSRLFLATFSVLTTLATAELFARFLLRPAAAPVAEGTPISELSPTLGWRTRPNGAQRIRRVDFDVSVSLNRQGLRGPDLPYEPAKGARRLVIMGDSFAHGYYAEEPATLRGRLGEALMKCGVDVVNAGAPGYSTDQEWIYFNEEVKKYAPKEVVLLFYYNDLEFNVLPVGTANRPKPLFVEKNGELELVPPVLSNEAVRVPGDEAPPSARTAPRFHGSALWSFLAVRLQRSRPDWSRSLAGLGLAPEVSTQPPGEYLPFGAKDTGERRRVEEMWKRTAAILRGFRDDVRKEGAGLTVFYGPSRFEANDDAWAFVQRRYGGERVWTRDAVRARLSRLLSDIDIPLIDALSFFQDAEKGGASAYLAVDGHWNARGNEIAYQALYPAMRRAFACGA